MSDTQGKKAEKVGTDGLTKKQRRALKVNAKVVAEGSPSISVEKSKVSKQSKIIKTDVDRSSLTTDVKRDKSVILLKNEDESKSLKVEIENKELVSSTNEQNIISKAELKAQRRSIQEAQRLTKQQKEHKTPEVKVKQQEIKIEKSQKIEIATKFATPKVSKVQLFSHLTIATKEKENVIVKNVHPAFVRLGAQYASKTVLGSNARCLALLSALKSLILNFESPSDQEFCRSLELALQNSVNYLQKYRPLAVSMTNALRCFKLVLAEVKTNISDCEKKDILIEWITDYINDEINKAGEAISMKVEEKISNGDIILTYGCSSLVLRILLEAFLKSKKQFRVIVVDSNPLFEGKEMLRRLVNAGIECTYVLINAISFIMNKTTKVLLGAHALLANGYVMSRIGTAQVALIAKAYSKPVLVCCETYKFCERVQTDSIVINEMRDASELIRYSNKKRGDVLSSKLSHLNLMYDVTPPDLVTAVATELAILPCTSVPVILRIDLEKSKKYVLNKRESTFIIHTQ